MSTNVFKKTHITKRQYYTAYDSLYICFFVLFDMKIAMHVFQTSVQLEHRIECMTYSRIHK